MGRPPDCSCHCECCHGIQTPIVLASWTTATTGITPDLTSFPAWNDSYDKAGNALFWEFVLTGLGSYPAGTNVFTIGGTLIGALGASPITVSGAVLFHGNVRTFASAYGPVNLRLKSSGGTFLGDIQATFVSPGGISGQCHEGQINPSGPSGFVPEVSLQLRCVCCSVGYAGATLYSRQWDHMHADYVSCVADITERTDAPCEAEVVGLTLSHAGGGTESLDVARLRSVFGDDFSWWQSWAVSVTGGGGVGSVSWNSLFGSEFGIQRAKMVVLGGFTRTGFYHSWTGPSTPGFPSCSIIEDARGDVINGSFDDLRDWLDLGDKVLILDGNINQQLITELGIASTWEGMGPIATHNFECSAGEGDFIYPPTTTPSLWGPYPPAATPGPCAGLSFPYWPTVGHPGLAIVADSHLSTVGVTNLVTIPEDDIGGVCGNKTTVMKASVLTPLGTAVVLGRVVGEIYDYCPASTAGCVPVTAVNYPCVVMEDWSGNSTSKIIVTSVDYFSTYASSIFLQRLYQFRGQF